jgi:hypothetical protein
LVAVATLFIYFVIFNACIPNHIHTMIPYIHPSPFAEASLHFLIALVLSGENLPVVPSRELNSGLPYSKPTRYQLSRAALLQLVIPTFEVIHAAQRLIFVNTS